MAIDLKEVMDKATAGLGKPKQPKHGMRNTHIDHHMDGSHTVRHMPHEGEPEVSYAVKNHAELAKKIKEYLGDSAESEAPKEAHDSKLEESAEKV